MNKTGSEVLSKGKNLILQEKFGDALSYFQDLYENEKKNIIYSNYIGIIHFLQQDYKTASEYFKKAIESNPENWFAYHKLGQICSIKKIDSCAIKYFTETIERNPRNLNSLLNLALIFQNDQEEIALELVYSALSIDPSNSIGNYLLGSIYMKKKEFKLAEEYFKKVAENNPKNSIAWYKLSLSCFKNKKYKRTMDFITEALQFTKNAKLFNLLGLLNMQKLNFEDAISNFKEAIKLEPENSSCWINLADLYFKIDKIESAQLCLREALKVVKNDYHLITIWTNLANIYEKTSQLSISLYYLEKINDYIKSNYSEKINNFEDIDIDLKLIHDINVRVHELKKQGIISSLPEEEFEYENGSI